jgi:hypothetical protein
VTFLAAKKIDKFQLRLRTAASLLLFSCLTFLIESNSISAKGVPLSHHKMKYLPLA